MKASLLYRIASVLLLLFAVGHTIGFWQADPAWNVSALLDQMRSNHFDIQGFNRSYWDFFLGSGLTVGVFYLFAAVLAWQLAGIPSALPRMRLTTWAFAVSFFVVTILCWRYLFVIPIVFSTLVTLCLALAAWSSTKQNP
jgi:hypothetical protein